MAVFLGVTLESAGVPIPGETVLLASNFLAHRGTSDLDDLVAFGVLGAVPGYQIWYRVGCKGGVQSCCAGDGTPL